MAVKTSIAFLFFVQLTVAGRGQGAHLTFSSLTSKDGLLSNTVNAILKDRYGWMWFATDDGLNRFDGTNFTVYRHIPGDSNSLRANEILALHEDSGGNLWVGTSGGAISLYDRKKDRFLSYPRPGDTSGLVPNAVIRGICSDGRGKIWIAQFESPYVLDALSGTLTKMDLGYTAGAAHRVALECVFADSRGRVWVGTDSGLFLYQPAARRFRPFRHRPGDDASLVHDHVKVIAEDGSGQLWVGTTQGLCVMQSREGDFTPYRKMDPRNKALGETAINAIVPDGDGKLWIGTMEGLHVLDVKSGSVSTYLPDGNAHGLTSKTIKSIYIDREGICWLGTDLGGVDKFDKNLNLFDLKSGDAFPGGGNRSPIVTSFAERRDGKVWVGTDGGGLYSFDRVSGKIKRVFLPVNRLTVLSLLQARSGQLYIGTLGEGLIVMDTATGRIRRLSTALSGNEIYSMLEDREGRIWAGTNGEGVNVLENERVVARYTPSPMTSRDILLPVNGYIRALEEDRDGNIWIGTHGGGLAVLRPGDNHFTFYNQGNSRLPFDKVHSLHCDSRGRMWVGTYGGGLSVFDRSDGHFINYTEKDGLQNTTIYQIVEDAGGRIWVSTNTGLSCFLADTKTFRNFSGLNGLQDNNFVHGAGVRLSDGELLFGGVEGFNYFDPAHLTINRNMPAVVLTDLQIANKSVQAGAGSPIAEQISVAHEIRLDYKQNFALSFVALNYTLPKRNQYAYLLEGVDKDWNVGAMNTARYTNLDPGQYRFRVKASNNDGLWSTEERSILIYVKPPFWRTVYAYIFYVLAAGGLLFYSRHRGIARIRNKFQLERERAEVRRTQELDRLKLKFLTNLSHEFRTPIALIMGPVNELLGCQQDSGSKEKLSLIRRNAGRLMNLVNQLLDFRKMEEQELKLLVTPGDLVSFVKDVVHSFSDLSGRKHIRLDFTSTIERLDVLFDHDKIERILFNLLSNAFKFTLEEGSISVVMEAAGKPDEAGKSRVAIRVADTGIGIPAEMMERIFERFFQHSSGEAVLNQGTGIGLSITKEFVRMHGGTIGVESEPGRGSVFTVLIPFEMAEAVPVACAAKGVEAVSVAAEETTPETEMPTILLVEDNEDFRWYLKDNLKRNYRIIEAANGNEGWQKALAAHPQLIVSDISMPQMDGIVLSKKLKADKRTCHVPIILLTAVTGEVQQVKGLETGANDYITKPFNFEVLHAKMRSLLELGRNQKSIYTRQIKLVQPEPGVQTEDERLLQSVAHCLEENIFSTQLSVEFLSRQVGMSRSSLYRKILEITGETPVEYIRSFKLEKAAILLEKSDLTVAEVAYQTGFTTPNYFARAFKAKFNILPSEYSAQKRKRRENPI
ncbi:MAG TPA: two-component regulator propeller domain-containing protein [Puia sp.]|uniref:hybrid sensor histidine kinase/response regulator transcription factor n=1 Tax=Puia sp. TaxID=2045100 RepID=UPI002B8C8867|nr:two-component regulator propeller domain-containing protein [Puia sp.]HVU94293.1 two-component regulator propeller domain-containing protein [Puia sp.]